jgi:hypothetical protein
MLRCKPSNTLPFSLSLGQRDDLIRGDAVLLGLRQAAALNRWIGGSYRQQYARLSLVANKTPGTASSSPGTATTSWSPMPPAVPLP